MNTPHRTPLWNRRLLWLAVMLLIVAGCGHIMAVISGDERGARALLNLSSTWLPAVLIFQGLRSRAA